MTPTVTIDPDCREELTRRLETAPDAPPRLVADWRGDTIVLHFAPDDAAVLDLPAAPATQTPIRRRRAQVDWYGLGVVLLMLISAGVAVYRLIWMGQ